MRMLGESSKAPLGTCLGNDSTKPLIPKYNPLEGCNTTEAKRDAGDSETMSVAPGLSGEVSGFKR